MKKLLRFIVFAALLGLGTQTYAQVGIGTNLPDKSAALDVVSTKRGLLIPRISISDLGDAAPVNSPTTSLLVYNDNLTTGEGFYYWDGSKWAAVITENNQLETLVQSSDGTLAVTDSGTDGNHNYDLSIKGGIDGQVMVTDDQGDAVWIEPEIFINQVLEAGNAIEISEAGGKITIAFDGNLTEDTEIATGAYELSISGLNDLSEADVDKVLVMDDQGVLHTITPDDLIPDIDAEDLELESELEFTTGNGEGAVLEATKIGIADRSIGVNKIADAAPFHLLTTNSSGEAIWLGMDAAADQLFQGDVTITLDASTYTFENTVEAIQGTAVSTTAPTATNNVLVFNDTNSEWAPAQLGLGDLDMTNAKSITTDGVIQFGGTTDGVGAVLEAVDLKIGDGTINTLQLTNEAVTNVKIADGAVTTGKIDGGSNNTVLITDGSGDVAWINQSDLFASVADGTTTVVNGDGSTANPYQVEVRPGNDETVMITDGSGTIDWVDMTQFVNNHIDAKDASSSDGSITLANETSATLTELDLKITPGSADEILTTNAAANGTEWKAITDLFKADNGLHMDGDEVYLGGDLVEATTIDQKENDLTFITDGATANLNIQGLASATEENEIVVVDTDNAVRTVARSLFGTVTSSQNVNALANYSVYTQEINVDIAITDLANSDIDLTLPDAGAAQGQVINIKISGGTEGDGYLNIIDDGTTLTYGGMPYQGWVVKSNGTNWRIVANN